MKMTRKTRGIVAAAAAAGLAALGLSAPADAALRTTVVVVQSNAMTSLNPGTPNTNLTVNADIAYITGSGFAYYDNSPKLVRNTKFGTFKVVKNTASDFRVQYTVNPGRVWSDGTPITGVDLLLSHVLSSTKYMEDAGIYTTETIGGKEVKVPSFDSSGYGGTYDNNIVGVTLSADKMSVTLRYKAPQPDWEVLGPGPSPVHALVHLADGKTGLQSLSANNAAKARFLAAYNNKSTAALKKMADVWSNDYHIKNVTSSTNKLLTVTNGAYIVTGAVADQSTTMTLNPKYNSGPATSGVKKIVFKYLSDGTPSAQALANGEIDIYAGQATAAAVALLKSLGSRVKIIGGNNSCYEHFDVRVDRAYYMDDTYTGPFKGMSDRAKDLRTAMLLTIPRQQIVDTQIKPITGKNTLLNSVFTLPGAPAYNAIVDGSGVKKYNASQETRTAQALALVKQYYPNASASNQPLDVKVLWGNLRNTRRTAEFSLMKAAAAKAGINLINGGSNAWGGLLDSAEYDAAFFAWCPTSLSQTGTNANFMSDGSNNMLGYNSPAMDTILKGLEKYLTQSEITQKYVAAEKLLIDDAITLGIFQHPAITAHNSKLGGVKPAPLSPTLVWNFWQWKWIA